MFIQNANFNAFAIEQIYRRDIEDFYLYLRYIEEIWASLG